MRKLIYAVNSLWRLDAITRISAEPHGVRFRPILVLIYREVLGDPQGGIVIDLNGNGRAV